MKRALMAMAIILMAPMAEASMVTRCTTDMFGNVRCTTSSGGTTTVTRCTTDMFGNVRCTTY